MFWFHTAFVNDGKLILTKPELDKACRDKKKIFSKDFKVEMYFMTESEYEEAIRKGKLSLKELRSEAISPRGNVHTPFSTTYAINLTAFNLQGQENGDHSESSGKRDPEAEESEYNEDDDDEEDDEEDSFAENGVGEAIDV